MEGVKIVQYINYYSSYFGSSFLLKPGAKILSQYSGGEPPTRFSSREGFNYFILLRQALRLSDVILMDDYNRDTARQVRILKSTYGLPDGKIVKLPLMCVNEDLFRGSNRDDACKKLGFDPSATNIISVSGIPRSNAPYLSKNPFLSLNIFYHLTKKFPGDYHLHFVGTGPGLWELKNMVRNLGIEDSVTLHGLVDHEKLALYYSASDLVINPYLAIDCRSGTATTEALFCKRPVVLFRRTPAIPFDNETCFCIDPDPEKGSEELHRILSDRNLLERKVRVRHAFVQHYRLSSVGPMLEQIYSSLLE